jgi:hypothetical protein
MKEARFGFGTPNVRNAGYFKTLKELKQTRQIISTYPITKKKAIDLHLSID